MVTLKVLLNCTDLNGRTSQNGQGHKVLKGFGRDTSALRGQRRPAVSDLRYMLRNIGQGREARACKAFDRGRHLSMRIVMAESSDSSL